MQSFSKQALHWLTPIPGMPLKLSCITISYILYCHPVHSHTLLTFATECTTCIFWTANEASTAVFSTLSSNAQALNLPIAVGLRADRPHLCSVAWPVLSAWPLAVLPFCWLFSGKAKKRQKVPTQYTSETAHLSPSRVGAFLIFLTEP